jgi:hypothetical protein
MPWKKPVFGRDLGLNEALERVGSNGLAAKYRGKS